MAVVGVPKMGDTTEYVVIEDWHVAVGDVVAEGEPLVSVETDKVTVDVPCPWAGTLVEITAEVGAEVPVGSPLCVVSE